jgi:RNA polymerase sigma factor (sigma-70 family)
VLTGRLGKAGQGVSAGPAGGADGAGQGGGGCASDADVIRASVREPGRFGEIFDRYADDILRYVNARLGADLAEDVTAETFLAAFAGRGSYDFSRGSARPWLYGIAVRQIGKRRRAERRYRQALGRVPAERAAADFGDRSADRATAQQLWPLLSAVLSGLAPQDRELLLLVAWADLTYEESAHALGVSVSAVKSRLHRIRAKTRLALGQASPARLAGGNTIPPPTN